MNGIQALGGARPVAPAFEFGASRAPTQGPSTPSGSPSLTESITGADGQSLVDIKDELQAAVQAALEDSNGQDPRAAVRSAVESTLESNGFDLNEVRSAMEKRMGGTGRPGGPGGGPPQSGLAMGAESAAESFVEQFLAQFRAGSNFDFEG